MMLAVDVDKECATAITTDDQYLALNYVWGKAKSLCLQKANFKQLKRPGGLSKIFPKLPRTIQDAITFAKQLGARGIFGSTVSASCKTMKNTSPKSSTRWASYMGMHS